MWAAENNHLEVVKMLTDKGADVNASYLVGIMGLVIVTTHVYNGAIYNYNYK